MAVINVILNTHKLRFSQKIHYKTVFIKQVISSNENFKRVIDHQHHSRNILKLMYKASARFIKNLTSRRDLIKGRLSKRFYFDK